MLFDKDVLGRLVTWIIFVALTDVLWVGRKGYDYYAANARYRIKFLRPPAWLFGPVWLILDVLRIAFIFMFVEWSIDINQWSFLTVSIMFIVQELLNKTWGHIFFNMRNSGLALIVATIMFIISLTITIITPVGDNIGSDLINPDNYKYTLMAFFLLYTLWLFYAVVLNWQWWTSSSSDIEASDNLEEQSPLLNEIVGGAHGYKKQK